MPWSQWILKSVAGCNHQTCFDSYVVISILEDGSLVSSSSFMPLCYLKESRQCLKEPAILSNQKKTWGGFAQGHRKELLYMKHVECRVHWKKRLDWAINKSQTYHSTTTIGGFIIHDRIAIMGDFMSLIVYPPDNQRPVFYCSLGGGRANLISDNHGEFLNALDLHDYTTDWNWIKEIWSNYAEQKRTRVTRIKIAKGKTV